MTASKPLLTGLLGLYIAQGIPFGVAMFALPGIFRSQGSSMAEIGLLALIMLPWGIKFCWASIVDNTPFPFTGNRQESHYLGWIRICQWTSASLMIGLFWFDPVTDFSALLLLLTCVTLIHTTQDIAVDAVAVQLSQSGKQASLNVNGVQVGGFSFGMLIGGSGALLAYDSSGWQGMVIYLLIALWLVYAPFYLCQKLWRTLPDTRAAVSPKRAGLLNTLKRPAGWKILLVALLFKLGGGMGEGLVAPLLVDQNVPLFWLSFITGSAMVITISVGAFIATRIGHHYPLKQLACYSLGLAALCWIALGIYLQFGQSPVVTTVLMIIEWLTTNVACVAFFGLFMRWCQPQQAGTDFTLLQCHEAIGGVIGMSLGAQLAGLMGFDSVFLSSGIFGILISLGIFWLLSEQRLGLAETRPATATVG